MLVSVYYVWILILFNWQQEILDFLLLNCSNCFAKKSQAFILH